MTWTGRIRDSVYFSILDSEWPEAKNWSDVRAARTGATKSGFL